MATSVEQHVFLRKLARQALDSAIASAATGSGLQRWQIALERFERCSQASDGSGCGSCDCVRYCRHATI
ncbi:MAG: hypothetical protein IE934_07485 [Sphingopyxis sp.]|nr:hypothetical protein [Sphingopyxis sp.]